MTRIDTTYEWLPKSQRYVWRVSLNGTRVLKSYDTEREAREAAKGFILARAAIEQGKREAKALTASLVARGKGGRQRDTGPAAGVAKKEKSAVRSKKQA